MEDVSISIGEIVDNHKELAEMYVTVICEAVVKLYCDNKCDICLLSMLKRLLICHGEPVVACQITVCHKVTMMAGLIHNPIVRLSGYDPATAVFNKPEQPTNGELKIARMDLLIKAFVKNQKVQKLELKYYIASLELLYRCVYARRSWQAVYITGFHLTHLRVYTSQVLRGSCHCRRTDMRISHPI